MDVPNVVKLSDMRRHWWIAYEWETVVEIGESEVTYVRCRERSIADADAAANSFDIAHAARKATAGDTDVAIS